MTKMSLVLVFGLLSVSAVACEKTYYGVAEQIAIPDTYDKFRDCVPVKLSADYPALGELDYDALQRPAGKDYSDYWSDWVLKAQTNPFLSQHFSSSYFGIGVWSPEEDEEEMTTQEWLMNHGLQFSVGFGEKEAGEPRLRLDYMWHEDQQDNLMMQVEVPF